MIEDQTLAEDARELEADAIPEHQDAPPPPVRRILSGPAPTVVAPPPGAAAAAAWTGAQAPPGVTPPSTDGGARRATLRTTERMTIDGVTIAYGDKVAVRDVHLPVRQGEVLALIGPSGCGKTTLLRSLNRLTELTEGAARGGSILLDGTDIDQLEVTQLRRRVSMVFQQPNPFPMSVFDNIAYALRDQGSGKPGKHELHDYVMEALTRAGLADEVAGNLDHAALRLSGGQQQRLCIARALAAGPEVLLLDEPCSALDPISTTTIEELILRLRQEVAVVIVTHNLQQARRVADKVAFMYLGDLIEYGPADQIFETPQHERTRQYIAGGFG